MAKREYRRPTTAQIAARNRNFRIFRLRGLFAQVSMLSPARRELVEAIIDDELSELGSVTETEARKKRHDELYARLAEQESSQRNEAL
ncbi:MAG: hypothetical protein A2792_03590 [Sphingomonadales bacterium RIFCSPHIGHO2_01_FULL_65_20]|nr:MAG: hypothetical protein A2792_03590 [Sphingomonadales bacterium RIFCSPHIGHO2_01_FULL_65_20]